MQSHSQHFTKQERAALGRFRKRVQRARQRWQRRRRMWWTIQRNPAAVAALIFLLGVLAAALALLCWLLLSGAGR